MKECPYCKSPLSTEVKWKDGPAFWFECETYISPTIILRKESCYQRQIDSLLVQQAQLIQDQTRLDFLQTLNDQKAYTGMSVLRASTTGRGYRLHESSVGYSTVREAIDAYMKENPLA